MKQILVLLMSLVIASPSYAQMSFGPPATSGPQQSAPTQPERDTFSKRSEMTVYGNGTVTLRIGNGWALHTSKNFCSLGKMWYAGPTAKEGAGLEKIWTFIVREDGNWYFRFQGEGPGWKITNEKGYNGIIEFHYSSGSWYRYKVKDKAFIGKNDNMLSIGVNKQFMDHFAKSKIMFVKIEGIPLGSFKMNGSQNGINMVRECKESL